MPMALTPYGGWHKEGKDSAEESWTRRTTHTGDNVGFYEFDQRFEHPGRTWASATHRAFSFACVGAAMANETWKFVQAKSKQAMKQVLGIRDEKARMKVTPPWAVAPITLEDDMRCLAKTAARRGNRPGVTDSSYKIFCKKCPLPSPNIAATATAAATAPAAVRPVRVYIRVIPCWQVKTRGLRAVLATIENDSTSFPGVGRLSQDCNMYTCRCKEDINVDSYRNKKR